MRPKPQPIDVGGQDGSGPVRRVFAWSAALSVLAIAMTEVARQEFSGQLDSIRIFFRLFVSDEPIAIVGLACLVLGALLTRTWPDVTDRIAIWFDTHPYRVAVASTIAFALVTHVVLLAHPFAADESTAVFQARVFAAGRVSAELPPPILDRLFGTGFLDFFFEANRDSGRVIANYWPGFAFLMAPFAAVRSEWLLNPILGGCTILTVHRLTRRILPERGAAGYAILFLLASPAFVVNSAAFFAMPAHLLANCLFALLLLDVTPARAFAAGGIGGFALILHHPYPHFLFAIPWILWLLADPSRRSAAVPLVAGYAGVLIPAVVAWSFAHAHVSPGAAGLAATSTGSGALGVALDAFRYAIVLPNGNSLTARAMDLAKTIVWSVPAVTVLAVIGVRRHSGRVGLRLLAASLAALVIGYCFVLFDQGAGWGARYFHPALVILPIGAAAALVGNEESSCPAVRRFALTTACLALVVLNTTALAVAHGFMRQHVAQLPARLDSGRQVILLDDTAGYYMYNLVQNDPFLRSPVIILDGPAGADPDVVTANFSGARLVRRERTGSVWRID